MIDQGKQIDDLNDQIVRLQKRLLEKEHDLVMSNAYLKLALMQIPDNKIEFTDQFYESITLRSMQLRKYRDFEHGVSVIAIEDLKEKSP